ncbi:hypothetical protein AB0L53_23980 [Nonomuraea sp. NPDC052129]|uniref:hypothetical protein n=1 Tax=Nonomuraea sp. NPDC052129 TaxID=3154651 RepID=UPI00343D1FC7
MIRFGPEFGRISSFRGHRAHHDVPIVVSGAGFDGPNKKLIGLADDIWPTAMGCSVASWSWPQQESAWLTGVRGAQRPRRGVHEHMQAVGRPSGRVPVTSTSQASAGTPAAAVSPIPSITSRGDPLGWYGKLLAAIAAAAWLETRGVVDRVLSVERVRLSGVRSP